MQVQVLGANFSWPLHRCTKSMGPIRTSKGLVRSLCGAPVGVSCLKGSTDHDHHPSQLGCRASPLLRMAELLVHMCTTISPEGSSSNGIHLQRPPTHPVESWPLQVELWIFRCQCRFFSYRMAALENLGGAFKRSAPRRSQSSHVKLLYI